MSTLADILDFLEDLLDGSAAGTTRGITPGTFEIVGDDHLINQLPTGTGKATWIEPCWEVGDPTTPSDVSGDYYYEARQLQIWVAYPFDPTDAGSTRDQAIADDEVTIKRCLMEPLNIALVNDWCKCNVSTAKIRGRDESGVDACRWLVATVTITYREDWS